MSDAFEQAVVELDSGAVAPVYVVYGEEFLVKKAAEVLIEKLLAPRDRQLNLVRLEAVSPREVVSELQTVPMFGGRKVVWVNEPEFLAPTKGRAESLSKARDAWKNNRKKESARRVLALAAKAGWGPAEIDPTRSGAPKEKEWEKEFGIVLAPVDVTFLHEVAAFCEQEHLSAAATDDAVLSNWLEQKTATVNVLLLTATDLETKHQLLKVMKNKGHFIEQRVASKLKDLDLSDFALQALAPFKKKLGAGALERLKERVGGNFRLLQSELEKLALHCEKETISVKEVDLLVGHARDEEFFELSDAIQKRNFEGAFKYVSDAMRQGTHAIVLLGSIASIVRNLLLGFERMRQISKGKPPRNYNDFQSRIFPEIEAEAKANKNKVPHPYAAFMGMQAAAQFGRTELMRALTSCADADLALKLGGGPLVLERLLWTVCGKASAFELDMHTIRRETER